MSSVTHLVGGMLTSRSWRAQVDELYKICGVLGSPTAATWPEGLQLAQQMGFTFPSFAPIPLRQLVPSAGPEALDLMARLCCWNPARRLTAAEALQHPFFQVHCTACCWADAACSRCWTASAVAGQDYGCVRYWAVSALMSVACTRSVWHTVFVHGLKAQVLASPCDIMLA